MAELETILAELERDDVDIDRLAERVARAAELIELCRTRIESARLDVTRIVARLTPD
jgi:exodeoxyribonuclease VII small subunit